MAKLAQQRPRRRPKQKKSNKIKNWIVVTKGDYINAAVDNHINTRQSLIKAGWKIVGVPAFNEKADAIDWIEAILGERYKRGFPPEEKK
jgi:hypothetical protein